jgi:hypothetical protein
MDAENLRHRIWLIADGIPLKIENVTIKIIAGKLLVTLWTQTRYLENITKANSILELENLKNDFSAFLLKFEEMRTLIKLNDLQVEYHLAYDEGKSGIGICSEIDGELNWYL